MKYSKEKGWHNILVASTVSNKYENNNYVFVHTSQGSSPNFTFNIKQI